MLGTYAFYVIAGLYLTLSGNPAVAQQLDMQQQPTTLGLLTSQGFEIKAMENGFLYLQKGKDVFACKLIVGRDSGSGRVFTRSTCEPLE